MSKKLSFDEFMSMLHELDDSISEDIIIKAIGGFSVILNSKTMDLNIPRMSEDIDSLTKTWDGHGQNLNHDNEDLIKYLNQDVDEVIYNIGEKYGVNGRYSSWLNNSWYDTQMYYDELEEYIDWEVYTEEKFRHIRLLYADLESIFLFKLRAINDMLTYDRPRDNDLYDALNIMRVFGENSFKCISTPKMVLALDMYPDAIDWLERNTEI